jgi:hypothetical protein
MKTADKPPQPKTRAERFAQQRRLHLKSKAKKVRPKTVATRPPVISLTQPLARKLPTVAPTDAAEPRLTQKSFRALRFAVAAMEHQGWSPNQKRLAAFHHLRQEPALSNVNPDDLISEQAKTDSCSTQKAARPIE